MTQQTETRRNDNGAGETLVIARTDEGYRVYSPVNPSVSYTVGGGPDEPTCTCPDFQYHQGDPRWRCKHILAVLNQLGGNGSDPYEAEERAAIQNEGLADPLAQPSTAPEMVIKRSVSPDGRIDSLSVEFSCPVPDASVDDIKSKALHALKLQAEIIESFLAGNGNGKSNGHAASQSNNGNGAAQPAQMLAIGGMNTKWGRRLFLSFQANGQTVRLFGSRKQLADALTAAGYPNFAERIEEGKQLNAACRIVTKPSDDGKYINVDQVLPAEAPPAQRRW